MPITLPLKYSYAATVAAGQATVTVNLLDGNNVVLYSKVLAPIPVNALAQPALERMVVELRGASMNILRVSDLPASISPTPLDIVIMLGLPASTGEV